MSSLPPVVAYSPRDRAYAIDVNQQPFDGFHGDLVFDEAAIRQCLGNLIVGYVGCKSRIFSQKFGSQTYNFLQDPLDEVTAAKMKASILQAISRWEDRVQVNASDIRVMPDRSAAAFVITVNYKVRATEKYSVAVFNLKLGGT